MEHCDQPFMLPNSTNFGSLGYDIIKGSPIEFGAGVDPGFSDPVFRMELTAQSIQNDFYVPAGYTLDKFNYCSSDSTTTILRGMTDYADYLSDMADVYGGNVGYFGTAFGGSSYAVNAYNTFYQDYERISVT